MDRVLQLQRRGGKEELFQPQKGGGGNHQQLEEDEEYGMQMSQIKDVKMVNVIPFCVACVFMFSLRSIFS